MAAVRYGLSSIDRAEHHESWPQHTLPEADRLSLMVFPSRFSVLLEPCHE